MNNLENVSLIKKEKLNKTKYFSSIIQEAYNVQIISKKELENIGNETLELLKIRIDKYNGVDSTSIPKDFAQTIMESNIYTMEIYLKKFENPDEAIKILKEDGVISIYNKGRKEIDRKLQYIRVLYEKVLQNKIDIQNYTYNSTIKDGIKGFLKIYNPDFYAQEMKITADYPTYVNLIGELNGVEFIQKYLEYIYLENKFCKSFSNSNLNYLLYSYDKTYKDLILNIFQVVLIQVIGLNLAKANLEDLNLSNSNLIYLEDLLKNKSKDETKELVLKAIKEIENKLFHNNKEIMEYILKNISSIIAIIYNSVTTNNLNKIFIVQKFVNGDIN